MPPHADLGAGIWGWDWVQILNCQRGRHANFELPNWKIFDRKSYRWNLVPSIRRDVNPMQEVVFENVTESKNRLAACLCKF